MVLWATAAAAALGAAYSEAQVLLQGGQTFDLYGMTRGAVTGALIGVILTTFDAFVLNAPLGAPLRRAPFAVHVAIKTAIYLGVILFALRLGHDLVPTPRNSSEGGDVVFSLAAAFVFVFILDLNSLLGQNVLINFITGRYYAPRVESRVFLLIDMEGSTGLAERLGPLGFHRLVNRFVDDLTQPIVAARGEIHRYVGDELIATWKLAEGITDGRCVTACFGAIDRLARRAPDYRRDFGAAVTVRAGLHCGPVVTGEMGSVKREIVFLGDTVNTAARIQDLCRQIGDRVIASAELVDQLELPAGIAKRSLGDLRLRGKGADLALYALTKAALAREGRSSAPGAKIAREERPAALS
ncbi:MAG: adenylate/guanylate cyclase domain-containing protein [Hyphomicrobiales bacterium]|nr:adenylate/guanylate cyclase domain-containing protein [Hyphomicrobiales bacterium]MBV9906749.1 adenylate/guanylate cyclase domain-containing protein [Hyphomicrobiales bacterium]